MGERSFAILDDRAVLRIAGADRIAFLQGLISNDVEKASADRAIYAAFLTAQGKYLHDFFVVEQGETLLVDCEGARADDLLRRLTMYKLRSQVTIDPDDNLAVAVVARSAYVIGFGLEEQLSTSGLRVQVDGTFVCPVQFNAHVLTVICQCHCRHRSGTAQSVADMVHNGLN